MGQKNNARCFSFLWGPQIFGGLQTPTPLVAPGGPGGPLLAPGKFLRALRALSLLEASETRLWRARLQLCNDLFEVGIEAYP